MAADVRSEVQDTDAAMDKGAKNPSLIALLALREPGARPLRALYIMMFLEMGGFAMCFPVMSFFAIKELGLTPSQMGFVISANATTQLVGSWACGRLSDSCGRRWLLLFGFAWSTIGVCAMAFVNSFMELLCLRALMGLSGGTAPLSQAYILDSVTEAMRPGFLGLFGFTVGIAFLCGNVAGLGLLALNLERRMIFLVAAFFCFLATVYGFFSVQESLPEARRRPLRFCHVEEDVTPTSRQSDGEIVGVGLSCIWSTRFFQALAGAIMFSTYAFLIDDFFGWADAEFGIIMASFGFVYAVLQFILYPLFGQHGRLGSGVALVVASICGGIAIWIMPTKSIIVHSLALLLLSLAAALFTPAVPVLVGYFAGCRHIGFANGVAFACDKCAGIIGPFIAGILYERSVWLMSMFGVACYVICLAAAGGIISAREFDDDDGEREPLVKGSA